ncbi:MAG: hypothetical protein ACEY3L_17805 [Wolbachia sp.]
MQARRHTAIHSTTVRTLQLAGNLRNRRCHPSVSYSDDIILFLGFQCQATRMTSSFFGIPVSSTGMTS